MWLSLEGKRPGPIKWSSPEQKQLALDGDIVVVQTFEQALAAAQAFEQALAEAEEKP